MSLRTLLRDDAPEPEDVEPEGFIRLQSIETGTIDLQADQLPLIREMEMNPPTGWVSLIGRYGAQHDFLWSDIREVEVKTAEAIAREFCIDRSYMSVHKSEDEPWK